MYLDTGTKAAGNLLRKGVNVPPGSLIHKFSHSVDHMEVWDLIHGKSCGFSNIKIQTTRPDSDKINEMTSHLVDKKIQSKPDMAALAKHRIDMDHPCVREYTKEEVDANRKFLAASSNCYSMHQSYNVRPHDLNLFCYHSSHILIQEMGREEVVSIILEYQATGNPITKPETLGNFLKSLRLAGEMKERIQAAEERKDDLKPQWLWDWQASQRRERYVSL